MSGSRRPTPRTTAERMSKPENPASRELFATVDPLEFGAMVDVDRYGKRSDAFDRLISQTHLHFWDPADPAYIDFDTPFEMRTETVIPMSMVPEMHSAVADRL